MNALLQLARYGTLILYVVRIVLTFSPEHAYIHPDEFFQFTEPIAGRVLHCKVYLPWEFTSENPIRSTLFPAFIGGSSFSLLKTIYGPFSIPPYLLLVLPRIFMTLLSFLCDWCLWKSLRLMSKADHQIVMSRFAFASSYVALTYFTRTFTNSLEAVLVSLLTVFVCSVFVGKKEKHHIFDMIGGLVSLGTFNRPTFICFIAILVLMALIREWSAKKLMRRFLNVSRSCFFGAVIMIAWDTNYYTDLLVDFWNLPYDETWSSIVITPLNFVRYNSQTENLKNHGLHPRWLHIVNLLLISSVLAIGFYWEIVMSVIRRTISNRTYLEKVFISQITVSLVFLSLFPHQEPRFLIPLLVPLCILYGDLLLNMKVMPFWLLSNCIFFFIYAFVHQAGVTRALFYLNDVLRTQSSNATIVFLNMYLPPQHLLNLNSASPVQVHDLSVSPFPTAFANLLNEFNSTNSTYIAGPSCLDGEVTKIVQTSGYKLHLQRSFFPHFSGEEFDSERNILINDLSLAGFSKAFSLNIWKLE